MPKPKPVAIPRAKPKPTETHHKHHPTSSSSSSSSTSSSSSSSPYITSTSSSSTSTSTSKDEIRWRTVLAHGATTTFLYGVLSTGIYCRPSCASRRPRRANVRFFDAAADARAAGLRACRRCRPDSGEAGDESPRAAAEGQVARACAFARDRRGRVRLLDVAAHVGLSPRYLHGLFKEVMGVTPGAYAAGLRNGGGEGEGEGSAGDWELLGEKKTLDVVAEAPFGGVGMDMGISMGNGPSSHVMNFNDPIDLVDILPLDDGGMGGGIPMVNWNPAGADWFMQGLEGFDASNFDVGQCNTYPEWFTECNLDVMRVSRMSSETAESPMSFDSAGCVDPSLLSALGTPI